MRFQISNIKYPAYAKAPDGQANFIKQLLVPRSLWRSGRNWKLEIRNSLALQGRGVTLIELLIVIAVIGVLSSIAISAFNPAAQLAKSRDAKRKVELREIQNALESYYQDNGKYPASALCDTNTTRCIVDENGTPITILWGAQWGTDTNPYMKKLPADPSSPTYKYVYYTDTNKQSYWIYATMERGSNDKNTCNNGAGTTCPSVTTNGIPVTSGTMCDSTGALDKCNYAVTSPNVSP